MKVYTVACFFLFAFISSAHAQLVVSKSTLEMSESNSRTSVRVTNSGADTLYVKLNLEQLLDPAKDESKRKPIDLLNSPDMLVIPQQMALMPGQTKLFRVITTKTNIQTDEVYRLNVVPFAGKPLVDDNVRKSAGVKILLGYKLLVLVRPEAIAPNIELQKSDRQLTFRNTGNTSVLLREISACDENNSVCEKLAANRVYPGETLEVPLPEQLQSNPVRIRTRQSVQYTENIVEY